MSRRIVVELGDRAAEALERTMIRDGSNITMVINRSVRVYDTIANQHEGWTIRLISPDGQDEKTLVIL